MHTKKLFVVNAILAFSLLAAPASAGAQEYVQGFVFGSRVLLPAALRRPPRRRLALQEGEGGVRGVARVAVYGAAEGLREQAAARRGALSGVQ